MVQTIHQTGEFNTYNILPVSNQCWLDRAEEIEIF